MLYPFDASGPGKFPPWHLLESFFPPGIFPSARPSAGARAPPRGRGPRAAPRPSRARPKGRARLGRGAARGAEKFGYPLDRGAAVRYNAGDN